ncbi:MAG TPA: accessory factor UbiK family protein [Alcaligenes sp.]|nr:accessory factor UbiK family protein [Alcaligenes sp.]HRL28240.1 accessory factor UbiK family protein [Alcaligenes sp.]
MINRSDWLEDLQKNVSELIAKSPAADIERNVKAFMGQTFNRMDLVTRDEFDTYKTMLERALARVAALETRLQALEGRQTPVVQPAQNSDQEPGQQA